MHPHYRHTRFNPFMAFFPLIAIFLMVKFFAFAGPWVLFLIMFGFIAMSKHRGWGHAAWHCDSGDAPKHKNDEKPKRRVIETADGGFLEVIDEPRQV